MATIVTLYEDVQKTKAILPRTKVSAVSNDSGVGLDALLNGKVSVAYATCATAAATAAKVVTIQSNANWSLVTGTVIHVKFTATNTAENPTINVNDTGAKSVVLNGTTITTSSLSYAGYANRIISYIYDGTNWAFNGWSYDGNTDTKVQQNAVITTANEYPVLLGYSSSTAKVTNTVNKAAGFTYNPSTQTLTAPIFTGAWNGSTIGVAYGGTGLTVSPSLLVNLGSTSAANVLQASPRPGVTGTLPIANGGTGATKWEDALTNLNIKRLFCSMVPYGTTIPASANLNTTTYLKVGNYFCASNANAGTLTNSPVTEAFMMQVYTPLSTTFDNETTGTWVYRIRKLMTYAGHEYIQYCYAGATANSWTYGAWSKMAKTSDITLSTLGITATAAELNKMDGVTATTAELNYVDGVTSNIQTQLDNKMPASIVSLELNSSGSLANYGGFIDFHYNGSTADYTSRIIEDASGTLKVNSVGFTSGAISASSTITGSRLIASNTSGVKHLEFSRTNNPVYICSNTNSNIHFVTNAKAVGDANTDFKVADGGKIYKGNGKNMPAVFISSSTPTALQTGDIWFVT